MNLLVRDPYQGQELARLDFATDAEIAQALTNATCAFEGWRKASAWDRSQLLSKVAADLEKQSEEFAQLIRQEAGKPIALARLEVTRALGVLNWASAEALRFSGELLRIDASSSGREGFGIVHRFPRGVILGITPFNFPLNLVLHKVAPALATGCAIIIKPAPATPLSALKLAELFERHSQGSDLLQVVLASDDQTSRMTQAPEIAMVSFTGSARVGALVRKQCNDKPVALELGGNAWVAVLEDVDSSQLALIAKRIVGAGFGYAGQSCISVQNIAVASNLWDPLREELTRATEGCPFGDPSQSETVCGPVINAAAKTRIEKELASAPSGSKTVRSKNQVGKSDQLIAPSLVILEKEFDGSLVNEEVFAPVMTVRRIESVDQLIGKINASPYGLQAGVFTQQLGSIQKLYQELRIGGLIVNDVPSTRYDHQPYGGTKNSGQAREGIRYAMEEMTEPKFLALSPHIPR
jgi:aldehyde dehydrogenase (NAD+)